MMSVGNSCQNCPIVRVNISNNYCIDMVLAEHPEHSPVLRVDVETFDVRLTASSKFLPSTLLHMD
jgi:hypothetical protein